MTEQKILSFDKTLEMWVIRNFKLSTRHLVLHLPELKIQYRQIKFLSREFI